MSDGFDPDAYLAEKAGGGFDPDSYLAEKLGQAAPPQVGPGETFLNKSVNSIPVGKAATDSVAALLLKAFGPGAGVRLTPQAQADIRARGGVVPESYTPPSLAEAYRTIRDGRMARTEAGAQQNPWAAGFGTATGMGLSLAAPLPSVGKLGEGFVAGRLLPGMLTGAGYGAEMALEHGKADLSRGEFGQAFADVSGVEGLRAMSRDASSGNYGRAFLDFLGSGALGGAAVGGAVPYAGAGIQRGAPVVGQKLQDFAGWLKVNSLHPNPTIAEDMAALPGGVKEVGKTLLRKGVGGFTKNGTAEQAAKALEHASGNIDRSVDALDATGAQGPDLSSINSTAVWRDAVPMAERPLTRPTGQKLGETLSEYQNIYADQPRTFGEGLKFRREIDDAIYKNDAFGAHPELTAFGKALRPVRGDVNAELELAAQQASPELAAQFRNANLETRQLGLASRAADRVAGRGTGNHVVSLKDMIAAGIPAGAGVAGVAAGHGGGGLSAMLASWLLAKYGSQAGARTAYGLGAALRSPRIAQYLNQGAAPARSFATLRDLLPEPMTPMSPAYAMGDDR